MFLASFLGRKYLVNKRVNLMELVYHLNKSRLGYAFENDGWLHADLALRICMGNNARAYAEFVFDIQKITERFKVIIQTTK